MNSLDVIGRYEFPPLLKRAILDSKGVPTDEAIRSALDSPEVREEFLKWREAHQEIQTQPLVGRIHHLATEDEGWKYYVSLVTSLILRLWRQPTSMPRSSLQQMLDTWMTDPKDSTSKSNALSVILQGDEASREMLVMLADCLEEGVLSPEAFVELLSGVTNLRQSPLHDSGVLTLLVPILQAALENRSLGGAQWIELLQKAELGGQSPLANQTTAAFLLPLLSESFHKGLVNGTQLLNLFKKSNGHINADLLTPTTLEQFLPLLKDSLSSGAITDKQVLELLSHDAAIDLFSTKEASFVLFLHFLKERLDQGAIQFHQITSLLEKRFPSDRCLLTQPSSIKVIIPFLADLAKEGKISKDDWRLLLEYKPDASLWWDREPLCQEALPLFKEIMKDSQKGALTVRFLLTRAHGSDTMRLLASRQSEPLISLLKEALSTASLAAKDWIDLFVDSQRHRSLLPDSSSLLLLAPILGEGLKSGFFSPQQISTVLQSVNRHVTPLAEDLILNKKLFLLLQELQKVAPIETLVMDVLVPTLKQLERSVHPSLYQSLVPSYLPFLEQAWHHHDLTREQLEAYPGGREAILSYLSQSSLPIEKVLELLPKIQDSEILTLKLGSQHAFVYKKLGKDPHVVVMAKEAVAEGCYGLVYRAERMGSQPTKFYAVKESHPITPGSSTQLRNEVAMLRRVYRVNRTDEIPGLQKKPLSVIALGNPEKSLCYLQPWCHGDLLGLMHQSQKLFSSAGVESREFTTQEKEKWSNDLLLALEAVHKAGVLHRDLKPENVLVRVRRDEILMHMGDFGSAKLAEECQASFEKTYQESKARDLHWPQTQSMIVRFFSNCTTEYLCYEDVNAVREAFESGNRDQFLAILKHVDDFALGCILYELWVKQRPNSLVPSPVLGFKVARVTTDATTLQQALLEAHCPEPLAKQIVAMIRPYPVETPESVL